MTVEPDVAVEATNAHYELPVEVFAAFLDSSMKYSSGLYVEPNATLEQAQRAKLDWVLDDCLRVSSGARLLDIGCGWGSLTLAAAAKGIDVVAVSPSAPQCEYVLRRAGELGVADRVEVRQGRFTALDLTGEKFDAVTMLGSIVHMPDREDVLVAVSGLLRPRGRLYLSESCFRNQRIFAEYRTSPGFRYVGEDIFGYGEMVPLAELVAAAESASLSIVNVSDLTGHYVQTLADWTSAVERNRDGIDTAVAGTADRFLRYFEIGATAFGYTAKHYALVAEKSRLGTWEV
ncbi:SAM-dependent methyltransferase [Lentzea sp. E54]|uniref:SAM-dependent methyltransferase n=1 Tax=Lentzea xerophila TaxID=3435883 RepID=UPI003DA47B17